MTDTGLGLSKDLDFEFNGLVFGYWIDWFDQSTSGTKLVGQALPGKGRTARFWNCGIYGEDRKMDRYKIKKGPE